MRRRVIVAIAAGVVLATGIGVGAAWTSNRPVAVIAGAPVTRDQLAEYRTLATDGAFRATTDAALLDRIAEDRALFRLARQAHLTDGYTSLDQVLAQRGAVNRSAATRAAQGKVVYGAAGYDDASFYGRVVAQLRSATTRALASGAHPELVVTDAQVVAAFRADPSAWSAAATTYHCTTVTVPGTVDGTPGDQVLTTIAKHPSTATSAAEGIAGATVATVDLHAGDLPASGLDPDAQASLPTLAVGATLPPQTHQGGWVLYRLDATSVDRTAALAAYRGQIEQQLLDRRFARLLDTTAAALRSHDS
ncbi:hypothetical protein ACLBWP_10465 [Microbacterium sp. M1A1_1b]